MSRYFLPYDGKPKRREIIAFDIEGTGGEGGFVCGAIVSDHVSAFYTDRERMFGDLLAYAKDGAWVYAHNLQYDLPILEGPAFPVGRLLFTTTRLLWSTYGEGKRAPRFLDSGNLFPRHSVSSLGELVNLQKREISQSQMRRMAQGHPWHEFTPIEQTQIERYCLRDAEIIYLAVNFMQELLLGLGGQLAPTIAGCAMDLYRRKYLKWPWPVIGEKTNKFIRPAFYGGRVENFAVGEVKGVNLYDITSLYPFIQSAVRFPHPKYLHLEVSPTGYHWLDEWEGVASVEVAVPNHFIPSLPHRHAKRLFFPVGVFRGLYTLYELRRAIASGVQLISCEFVIGSKVTFNPFEDYTQDLFRVRSKYLEAGSGHANLVKLLLNSLYGRWGLNPDNGLYKMVEIGPGTDLDDLRGYVTHELGDKLLAYGRVESKRPPDYVNLFFAAQITSAARCHLLDELERQGEEAVYCDTDSIITRGKVEISEGLGGWRLEMENGRADLIGPKEYALHNAVCGDKYVCKGVPESVARDYITQGSARFYRALGVREAIKQGKQPSEWIETFRVHQPVFPKRYPLAPWQLNGRDFTPTRPYLARELPLVCSGAYLPPDLDLDHLLPALRAEWSGKQRPLLPAF